ncbi:unnamed protein product [Allacma fusca]|uniref:Ionotropic glutamate receptor C-terminal domain-containing protein n=1 Tax=Allacma fusca TaxID=39272 RepID=A0A8J2NRM7_9HEXA|nr:unnamed protein product [Allacma fusca]
MKTGLQYCRIRSVGGNEGDHEHIINIVSSENYITVERSTNAPAQNHSKARPDVIQFSSFCINIVVFPAKDLASFRQITAALSASTRLEMLHFIFLETQNNLANIWNTKLFQRLKFKTGLLLDKPGLEMTERESPSFDSTNFNIVRKIPPAAFSWSNLRNQHLVIGLLDFEPYVIHDAEHAPKLGMMFTPLLDLVSAFNVSADWKLDMPGESTLPNGSYEGFVGDLEERRIDLCFTTVLNLLHYVRMDYSSVVYVATTRAYISHPKVHVKWEAILYPFDFTVWMVILGFFFGIMPLIYIHLVLKRSESSQPPEAVYLSIVLPYSALLQESRAIPKRVRFLMVMIILYSIIIAVFYNSNLVSFLTFPEPDAVPQSFEELAARKDYTIYNMYYNGGAMEVFFNEATLKYLIEIDKRRIKEPDFSKCIRHALFEPRTACLGWPVVADPMMAKNFTLHSSFIPLRATSSADSPKVVVGLQKNSKHFTSFNSALTWAVDTGHYLKSAQASLEYLQRNGIAWLKQNRDGETHRKLTHLMEEFQPAATKPFGIKNFVLCFAAVLVGGCLGAITWIFEMILRFRFKIFGADVLQPTFGNLINFITVPCSKRLNLVQTFKNT